MEDLQQLSNKLESWASIVPPEAEGFHETRMALAQERRRVIGSFPPDPAAESALRARFEDLELLLPRLQELLTVKERALAVITELRAFPFVKGPVHLAVQTDGKDWMALIDFLVRSVSNSGAAQPAIFQVKRITTWADRRKRALEVLSEADKLHDAIKRPEHKNEIHRAIIEWSKTFCAGKVDDAWENEAEQALRRFAEFRRVEAIAEASKQEKAEKIEEVPAAAPLSNMPPNPSAAAKAAENARMHFFRIDQALAECRDLADALGYQGPEITELTSRHWQLRNAPDLPLIAQQKAEDDIEACRTFLIKRAEAEANRRLEQLRIRWQWFRSVYGEREEIDKMVQDAEAEKPNAAQRLRELFALIRQAEQRIYAVVDGNRPKLAAYVRKAADECRAEIEDLRQQPRLTKVDAVLAGLEQQIPEDPGSQVAAKQSFERLEQCHGLLREIHALRETNEAKRAEVLTLVERLTDLIGEIVAISDAAQIAELAARIPKELPPERRLDDIWAELIQIEAQLDLRRLELCRAKTAELLSQRKDNLAWIKTLVDFAPEAEALAVKDPAPQDLETVCLALAVEYRHRDRIAQLRVTAGQRLIARSEECKRRLRSHLDKPAFETHPERDSAEQLVRRIDGLSTHEDPLNREEFSEVCEAVAEAEGFVDRIESARQSIPERLRTLEDRFSVLRELNGIAYRPELARRGNLLLQGIYKAIEEEHWEPLYFQLTQTDNLFEALERDALAQISAETEQLAETLEKVAKRTNDEGYARQIASALKELEAEWQLEPPPYSLRRRLSRLAARTVSPGQGRGL